MSESEHVIETPLPFAERFSDRLNPILLREINQSLGGRVFVGTLFIACAAVAILCLIFTWEGRDGPVSGQDLLIGCLMCIVPVTLIIVPMQAFTSTRQEVSGGTAEQLLMTRLRPSRIVIGKLAAGLLQFVIFASVFAPVIAISYLLNGVDVPTIAIILLFALLAATLAVSLAVAMGSVNGPRSIQQLMQGLTTAALFISGFSVMGSSWFLPRAIGYMVRSDELWPWLTSVIGAFVAGIVLCGIVAATSLAHAYENRSSPFRVFVAAALAIAIPWMYAVVDAGSLAYGAGWISAVFAACSTPFWLWAACEEESLSPRVRTLVPRSPLAAALSAPFLPGGQRGLAYAVVLAVFGILAGWLPSTLGGVAPTRQAMEACVVAWSYVVLYAAYARFVRSRIGHGRGRSILAFVVVVATSALLWSAILIFDLAASNQVRWHAGHIVNPFFTIERLHAEPRVVWVLLSAAVIVAVVSTGTSVRRGFREVLAASAARRALAA